MAPFNDCRARVNPEKNKRGRQHRLCVGDDDRKALDADGKRLFQDGEKAALKNAVDASVLQELQLAMLSSGASNKVEDAKADLKSK